MVGRCCCAEEWWDVGGVISSTLRTVGEPWSFTQFQLARFNDFVAVGVGSHKKSRQRAARLAISFTAFSADHALGSCWGESIQGLLTQACGALKVPVKIAHVSDARASADLKGTVGDALRRNEGSFEEAVEQWRDQFARASCLSSGAAAHSLAGNTTFRV